MPAKSSSSGAAGEPSAEFVGKGPNGKLATVGKESSVEEREAASKTVEESLAARESGDWAGQCETLTAALVKELENGSAAFKASCPAQLEAQARNAPKAALENTMTGPIAALRVNGSRAFAFYHGARGEDYVILMEKEGTEWKVAALSPQEAP